MDLFIENNKKIILIFLIILSLFLISFRFTDTPNVWGDEGVFTNVAETFAQHGVFSMKIEKGSYYPLGYFLSTNYPVLFPVASSLYLFGNGIWQERFPMLVFMFLFLVVSYLFVKKKYGYYPAILSTLFLLSFSPFYGNGRPVQGEVPGLFFLVLGGLFLLYLEDKDFSQKKWAFLSGLLFGLSSSTKTLYLILLSVTLIFVSFSLFKKMKDKINFLIFWISYLTPILFWFFLNSKSYSSFFKAVEVYKNLATNNSGIKSASLFITVFHNASRFVTETTPALFLFIFFVIGGYFLFRYLKDKEPLNASEMIICVFIVLNILAYLPGTGWYRYFFPAHLLSYLLFPVGLIYIIRNFANSLSSKLIMLIPLTLIIFQFFHLVYLSDTSFVAERTRNPILTNAVGSIESDKKVLFYDTIEAIVFFKGEDYYQYSVMENFFVLGDKDILDKRKNYFDYILVSNTKIDSKYLNCYSKNVLGKYSLYEKRPNCK